MTPEERKLMISMAKTLDHLGKKVVEIDAMKIAKSTIPQSQKVVSQIEHDTDGQKFRMDIKFIGLDSLTQGERMEKSTAFLAEMESLLTRFKVEKLTGSYINVNV